MADVEPYVDMPYSELAELKKQIKNLQGKGNVDSDQLIKSVTTLTKNMDSMLQLFKTAVDEMKLEEQEEKELSKQIQPLMNKLDEIIEQNKIIAEGMVAVADLVKERLPEISSEETEPRKFPTMPPKQSAPPPMGQPPSMYGEKPSAPPPQPMAPPNMPPPENASPLTDLPPPPGAPKEEKKQGLFGKK